MRLIQFNVYFSHHLHIIFVLSYITYIVRVRAWGSHYVPCLRTRNNTVLFK